MDELKPHTAKLVRKVIDKQEELSKLAAKLKALQNELAEQEG